MSRRIVISNVYSDDNRGGAAITSAAIDAARRAFPDCDIALVTIGDHSDHISQTHRHTLREHPDVSVLPAPIRVPTGRLGGLRAAVRALGYLIAPSLGAMTPALQSLRAADLVVGKGGQAFRVRQGLAGVCALWLAMFPPLYARRLGIPAAVYSVTVGPYPGRSASRMLTGWILRRLDLVMVRDDLSRAEARAFGVGEGRLVQVPDSVLGMEPPTADEVDAVRARLGLQGVRFGAVTVTRPRPNEDPHLFDYLSALLLPLLERRVVDRVVVVVQTDGSVKSDYPPSKAFVDYLSDRRVTLLREDLPFRELCALYSAAMFTVGSRIHSAILSVIGSTPAFPLLRQRAHKADSIFQTLGLADDVVHVGRPAELYVGRIAEAVEEGERRRAAIRETVAAARGRCRDQVPAILRGLVAGEGGQATPVTSGDHLKC